MIITSCFGVSLLLPESIWGTQDIVNPPAAAGHTALHRAELCCCLNPTPPQGVASRNLCNIATVSAQAEMTKLMKYRCSKVEQGRILP